jgi:pyruvate formate-lyase/glycerol dehydratase family glycyl radical enzyme
MTDRIQRLRAESLAARPTISAERALLLTEFYREEEGRHSASVLRALAFQRLCERKTIHIGPGELIVGERGPAPKATPTYPELTCHSLEDLRILDSREKTSYAVGADVRAAYEREIIPYWRGRSLRSRIFASLPPEWHRAYEAGIFTEFMEQRAPGHTVADGKIYRRGLRDFQAEIGQHLELLADDADPESSRCREQLRAMSIAADAAILFAERHAAEARRLAGAEPDAARRAELERIAGVCARVPAHAPRDFHEALQAYWFVHLAVITELNGWDSFCPGHLDQHLEPFYHQGLADGTLTREQARELLQCFFIKFNNQPAPPKVGVTAAESGTYTDFANINLGGLRRDGTDGVSDVSYLLLEVIEELHILQPSQNVQISRATPEEFLLAALRVIRQGYGYPSVFNTDVVIEEMLRQGKSLEDAREGGTSGCVETGAFGKEAYILTGYFNLPKVLELALHNGRDPRTRQQLGPTTGDPSAFGGFADLFGAWERQVGHFVDLKIRGNEIIERIYAEEMPAPFLSLITDDCIATGRDYNAGGARYNTSYIQGVGIGTLTDCLAAIRKHVYQDGSVPMADLLEALRGDFAGREPLRQRLRNRSPKWGNDDDEADELMRAAFEVFLRAVDGRPNLRGGRYHIDMLPTTCHVYFGSVTGATPDGRRAWTPLSEGISPVQGQDRRGPTAVFKSAAKMDHVRTGGTLLNMKFLPQVLEGEESLAKWAALVRTYFRLGGHHVQFNVVGAETLRAAQADPESHRDLIVRVAGYSDYFCDLSRTLQDEIIARTEQPLGYRHAPRAGARVR